MRIKVEDPKNLRALSSLATAQVEVKDKTTQDSSIVDGFLPDDVAEQSPFSLRRQLFQLDPHVDISEDSQINTAKPWWHEGLLESLPPLNLEQGALRADIEHALRCVSRDKSFLTINWRDDLN